MGMMDSAHAPVSLAARSSRVSVCLATQATNLRCVDCLHFCCDANGLPAALLLKRAVPLSIVRQHMSWLAIHTTAAMYSMAWACEVC